MASPHEAALRRIALPLAKFWVCKRTPGLVAEALECLGGNGYVEESGLPLLYREAPLNSVWEGSGNVNALDVLRALSREPEVLDAWITEVGLARGADARLDRAIDDTLALLGDSAALEVSARRLAGRMAACLQGSLLVRYAPPEVADVFCASRLAEGHDGTYGALASPSARPPLPPRPRDPGRLTLPAGRAVSARSPRAPPEGAVAPLPRPASAQSSSSREHPRRHGSDRLVPERGAVHPPDPPVVGVGLGPEVAGLLELGHELAAPLLGHPEPLPQLRDADPLVGHAGDHPEVRLPQPVPVLAPRRSGRCRGRAAPSAARPAAPSRGTCSLTLVIKLLYRSGQ